MGRRNRADFLEFAAAYRDQMRRTAYLLCGDQHRASDITQEALIRLYVAWPRLDDNGLRSYARRAVTSAAIDFSRKRSSHEPPVERTPDAVGPDPTEEVAERLVMLDALAKLPPRQRACVVLRYYEDLSVEEIAQALGCSTGTVKSQTARGLSALRAAYGEAGDELVIDTDPAKEASAW
jgi:RNA polymerase sigma-70 factor (sigma-E family)